MTDELKTEDEARRATRIEAAKNLYSLISEAADDLRDSDYALSNQTGAIRDLALAYRYIDGGAQPGASVIEK